MVIQHNLPANNADRQLRITSGQIQNSTEKLSSGYRINRAGDDAAGLSISEKMRSQIRGLEKASANAQDGVSLIQTAEGALNEVHSILQRMNELATQAANDTNTSVDRTAIQKEIDELLSEIDRIQSTTQFNTMNLIDGSFSGKNLQVGALSGQRIEIGISNMSASALGLRSGTRTTTVTNTTQVDAASIKQAGNGATAATNDSSVTLTITDPSKITRDVTLYWETKNVARQFDVNSISDPNNSSLSVSMTINGTYGDWETLMPVFDPKNGASSANMYSIYYMAAGGELASASENGGSAVRVSSQGWYALNGSAGEYYATKIDDSYFNISGGTPTAGSTRSNGASAVIRPIGQVYESGWAESSDDPMYTMGGAISGMVYNIFTPSNFEATFGVQYSYSGSAPALGTSAWITLNTPTTAANNEDGKIALISSSSAQAATDGISVMSFSLAGNAMERIQSAIDIVSTERSKLGALQNRLEHTIANLDNIAENTQSAESRIRDTDMADEMVRYSKNSILAQAGQTVLAQANQSTQGVLALLS